MDIFNCKVDSFTYKNEDSTTENNNEVARNKISSIISSKTGSSLHEINKKPQIQYLLKYLSSDEIKAKTLVTEYDYIDKHYIDDYSKYYSRCFHTHGRECARIHFFSEEFNEQKLIEILETQEDEDLLKNSYLGYCVIRPIPENYLGRLSLVPYNKLLADDTNYKIITQKETTSLFGLELTIETASMREQDQVVSACATSAIWTALNLTPFISNYQVPSLSTITDIATGKSNLQNRTFTNSGLTIEQVSTVLKHYQLESLEKSLGKKHTRRTLCRWLKAYSKQNIPVLLSGKIYDCSKEPKKNFLGDHFVCIVGFRQGSKLLEDDKNENKKDETALLFKADKIDRCYVHDDRYGQYVAIKFDSPKEVTINKSKTVTGYSVTNIKPESNKCGDEDIFVPTNIIIGLDNKIRLNYSEVEEISYSLFEHLKTAIASNKITDTKATPQKYKGLITSLETWEWDIELISNKRLKDEVRKEDAWFDSSFGINKNEILIKSLPKHMWRIRIEKRGIPLSDLLFDATEVFQDNILLGFINYSEEMVYLWKNIQHLIDIGDWRKITEDIETYDKSLAHASICISSLLQEPKSNLDKTFGSLRLPCRDLHETEIDSGCAFTERPPEEVYTITSQHSKNWPNLDKEKPYIWLIDAHGHLIIAEDVLGENKNGHTTLNNYKPARLGGEFYYKKDKSTWVINTMSGAYSLHINHNLDEQESMLQTVHDERFKNYEEPLAYEVIKVIKEGSNITKKITKFEAFLDLHSLI